MFASLPLFLAVLCLFPLSKDPYFLLSSLEEHAFITSTSNNKRIYVWCFDEKSVGPNKDKVAEHGIFLSQYKHKFPFVRFTFCASASELTVFGPW